ncbi:hypothetical protein [Planctomicrobium piriforme]|uniref:Uncharacterized protein n=1 Tax=Planctomicrobium piriforme TaxID=1576369 RepID=A0A1I3MIZ2_9PLAN|nr:hypothetical protein [Planctomicrobium piriforme]SFI97104.1 hypothetical protein SAMN05421753_11425 [Planctomicrobium piriforme]
MSPFNITSMCHFQFSKSLSTCLLLCLTVLTSPHCQAAEPAEQNLKHLDRIYVPAEQLDAVLKQDSFSAVLSRDEFEKLVSAARAAAALNSQSGQPPMIGNASYQAQVTGDQLKVTAEFLVASFAPAAELDFDIEEWNIESAQLDNQPATVARTGPGLNTLRLFLSQPGSKVLKLQLSTPLQTAGSDRLAAFHLPTSSSGLFALTLPAGKSLLANELLLPRPAAITEPANYSLPIGGQSRLALTITDRQQSARSDSLTFASTAYGLHLQPGEVTWSATTQLQAFGRQIDRLVASVPSNLEVTDVSSDGLESWTLDDDAAKPDQTRITLKYRVPFDGSRSFTIRGILSPPLGQPWSVPALRLDQVTAHTGLILIWHPEQLRLQTLEESGVRPIPNPPIKAPAQSATAALAFEVWQEDFSLRFATALKESPLQAAMTNLLFVRDSGVQVSVTVSLQSRLTPVFDTRLKLPADYRVNAVLVGGQPVDWQTTPAEAGINEIQIPFNPPLLPGQSRTIALQAIHDPENWPVRQTPVTIPFPSVGLAEAGMVEVLYGVCAPPVLEFAPLEITGLEPASKVDMAALSARLQAQGEQLRLGFSGQTTTYRGQLQITRQPGALTTDTLTFFQIEREQVSTHIESRLSVSGGGMRTLTVETSEAAGDRLRFALTRTSDNSAPAQLLEQVPGTPVNGFRPWTLNFDRDLQGDYLLTTDITLPRNMTGPLSPVQVRFPLSTAQSGFVAVEGADDEEIRIVDRAADGKGLQVVDPIDFPPSRYRPQARVIAGYRYAQPGWTLDATSTQFSRGAVPPAVGTQLSISTVWQSGPDLQQQATLRFRAVGMQNIAVTLPADARLWSTLLDSRPIEARQTADGLQIPISQLSTLEDHTLTLLYDSPNGAESGSTLRAVPPRFTVTTGAGSSQPLPILEQTWNVHYPETVALLGSDGPFQPEQNLSWGNSLDQFRQRLRHLTPFHFMWTGGALIAVTAFCWFLARASRWEAVHRRMLLGAIVLGGLLVVIFVLAFPAVQNARNPAPSSYYAPVRNEDEVVRQQIIRPFGSTDPVSSDAAKSEGFWEAERFRRIQSDGSELVKQRGLDRKGVPATNGAYPGAPPAPAPAAKPGMSQAIELDGMMGGMIVQTAPQAQSDRLPEVLLGDEAEKKESLAKDRGQPQGLLSLAAALQIPDDSASSTFVYRGNHTAASRAGFELRTANKSSARMLLLLIAVASTCLGWRLRDAGRRTRALWIVATIIAPLALLSFASGWTEILLCGLLLGGAAGLITWLLRPLYAAGETARASIWTEAHKWSLRIVAPMLLSLAGGELSADEKPLPPQQQPPYVVIPYQSLDTISSSDRVWVPAKLFEQLWRASHTDDLPQIEPTIPATIAEANYVAALETSGTQSRIVVKARWVAINLTARSQTLVLPIRHPALENVTIGESPAAIAVDAQQQPTIVLPGRGVHVIDATVILPADVQRSVGQFSIETLPVAAGTLTFELPRSEEPLSVRVNGGPGSKPGTTDGRALVQAPVDRGGKLAIAWQPERQQNDAGTLLQLETSLAAVITDVGLNLTQNCQLAVRQGTAADCRFQLPPGLAIRQITGSDVAGWEISGEQNGARELQVLFRRAITNQTTFQLELFQPLKPAEASQKLAVQTPVPLGMARETGLIGLYTPSDLRVTVSDVQGLQQVDTSNFRAAFLTQPPAGSLLSAYRYSSRPIGMTLNLERRVGQTRAVAEYGVQVGRRKLSVASKFVLTLSEAPRKQLHIALPAGYEPVDVVCAECTDWFVSTTNGKSLLTLELDRPRTGAIEIGLEGQLPRTENQDALTLSLPVPDADQLSSSLGIWIEPSEQATLPAAGTWRSVSPDQLPTGIRNLRAQPIQFALLTSEAPAPLQLSLRRLLPELQGDAGILIAVGDATVDYGLTLRWRISRSTAESFAFTVPDWLGPLEFTGQTLRQIRSEPAEKGRTRWILTTLEPVGDQFLITAAATVALPTNQTIQTPVVEFITTGGTNPFQPLQDQRKFAVLVNLSQNQLSPVDAAQFDPLTADDLPLTLPASLVQQAMDIVRVRDNRLPTWKLLRPERVDSSKAVVLSATLTTVLQPDGSWRTRAIYGVRNRGQQFLALRIPSGSQVLSVLVRGEPSRTVLTKLGEEPIELVPLPQTSAADLSFDVVLILSGNLPQALPKANSWFSTKLTIPAPSVLTPKDSPELGVSTAQTLWNVYVPDSVRAAPVESTAKTNVTWHHGDGWLEAEMQSLSRFRADLADLKQIMSSSSVSSSQRDYARENLKQLGAILQQQNFAVSEARPNGDVNRYLEENKKVLEEAEALADLQAATQSAAPVQAGQALSNRSYINLNNSIVQSQNQAGEKQTAPNEESARLNFFGTNDTRRRAGRGTQVDELEARSKLKSQVQQQAPALQEEFSKSMAGKKKLNSDKESSFWEQLQPPAADFSASQPPNYAFPTYAPYDKSDKPQSPPTLSFTPSLDVPFRQGSFDIAAPTFGGFDPNTRGGVGGGMGGGDDKGYMTFNAFVPSNAPFVTGGRVLLEVDGKNAVPTRWTAAGGLSVPIQLPVAGHELAFSRVGGNPVLTLSVSGVRQWSWLLELLWAAGCLLLGAWVLWTIASMRADQSPWKIVLDIAIVIGAIGFVFGPGGDRWLLLTLFCAAALTRMVWATRKATSSAAQAAG